ncbi:MULTISPECIES: hypothetical protein [unclassified Methylobacterium]|uniref:DUF1254 domain-containing protein n=1 Tax=unclassified Methylobacterium TaxID=2615210 RepID=UPI0006F32CB1|nr:MULTISPECIES: hypothetical protein [unclassified Methylobacterium]KQO65629.1 hypothetical protein ASF20_06975 [Methylobacterium sp. Leaf88]KQO68366.1 hypothetical protein ASF18_04215 [Methylobacterium sp. Leaf89]KQP72483.1 hypothetical protein ASF41_19530 [Methylobacterium sp. Leaf111]KQT73498.1 hypothetical protein ASG51_08375 [Methylobacterium sp. Leaf465]KQU21041.1 hypothetical protein ASG63_05270 [Methylobacterium sp. Leaf94]
MTPRGRFLVATLSGLVLAGLVHGATVLLIPRLAESDALSRARSGENLDHPLAINTVAAGDATPPVEAWLPIPDPAVAVGLCAYDLSEGPMRVSARTGSLMLSLAVHGQRGAFYAVTDQAAVRGALDLVVLTRSQYDEALANADEDEVSHDVRIVAGDTRGFVVVRVIAALPSQRTAADAAVQAVSCTVDSPGDEKTGG